MTYLPFRLDPATSARVFGSAEVVQSRITELTAVLAPHTGSGHPPHPDEAALRLELTLLHLAAGNLAGAAGANVVAGLRADLLPGRKKVDRAVKKHARHLARLGQALGWQWQGRYVHSTMLYLELVFAIDDLDRETQALTELCSATNDADQGLWEDAASHFEQAIMVAAAAPVLPELRAEARIGYRAARRMLGEAA